MSDIVKSEAETADVKARREFLKGAGKAAIAAPAVALILSASATSASATPVYCGRTCVP